MALFHPSPLSKAFLLVLLLIATGASVVWFSGLGRGSDIAVGFIGTLTGPHSEAARDSCRGAILAINECNDSGGLLGKRVKLVIRDDGADPKKLLTGLQQLVQIKVQAAIGPTIPSMAPAASMEANRLALLLLSPTVGIDRDSPRESRVISVYPSGPDIAEQITRYLTRHQLRRPAIALDVACAPAGLLASLQRNASFAGESITATVQYESAGTSVSEMLNGIMGTNPDCIIIFATPRDTAYFVQQLRRRGQMLPVIISEDASTPTFLALGGPATDGAVLVSTIDVASAPERFFRFKEKFAARFGREPGYAAVHGYDCARILLSVISRQNDTTFPRRSRLTGNTFEGVQGRILFTDSGEVRRELYCTSLRRGAMETLE